MDFGNRLRKLRLAASMTQEELAKILSVQRPAISGYETKHQQPDFDRLLLLADCFNVSVDFLLGRNTAPHSIHHNQLAGEDCDFFVRVDDLSRDSLQKLKEYKKMLLLLENEQV